MHHICSSCFGHLHWDSKIMSREKMTSLMVLFLSVSLDYVQLQHSHKMYSGVSSIWQYVL